jgi:hypothetical protein
MSNQDTEPATNQIDGKPNEFAASGGSPPMAAMPPGLIEELAAILADALVAEYEREHQTASGERPSGFGSRR